MPDTHFPSLPDDKAALIIAMNEGYTVATIREQKKLENAEPFGLFELHLHGKPVGSFSYLYESQAWEAIPEYCTSLDAAVAWLKRMGLEWERRLDKVWIIYVWDKNVGPHAFSHGYGEEDNNCSLARAICNAGWQAITARTLPSLGNPQPVQNPPMIPDWTCVECGSKNPEWATSETIFGTEHEGHCSECGGDITDSPEVGLRSAIQALDDRRAKLVRQLTVELGHEPCMVCGHEICYEDGNPPLMECANCHATYDTVAQSVAAQLVSKHEIEALQDQLAVERALVEKLTRLDVGDVVRLEKYEGDSTLGWIEIEAELVGSIAVIDSIDEGGYPQVRLKNNYLSTWKKSACTLICRAKEVASLPVEILETYPVIEAKDAEIDRLTEKLRRETITLDSVRARRDAVRTMCQAGPLVHLSRGSRLERVHVSKV